MPAAVSETIEDVESGPENSGPDFFILYYEMYNKNMGNGY